MSGLIMLGVQERRWAAIDVWLGGIHMECAAAATASYGVQPAYRRLLRYLGSYQGMQVFCIPKTHILADLGLGKSV